MIDVNIYRQNESLAKKEMSKWQIRARHNLDAFEKAGFPVRVENNQQLRSLIDTMNENSFDVYQAIISGFNGEELKRFIDACVLSIDFCADLFPTEKPILALNNIAQALVFDILVSRIKPSYKSILEIGPGIGALALLLANRDELEFYAQVEACESFYLLQSHLCRFIFKSFFTEKVFLDSDIKTTNFWTVSSPDSFQLPIELDIEIAEKKAAHYPWWKLGELANSDIRFDVVASNANLLEFSRAALLDYLPLIQKKLKDDGLFIFHCTGSEYNGTPTSLMNDLYEHDFAPLFFEPGVLRTIGEINSESRRVVIAPAGNFATKQLLQDEKFTSHFDEIVLLDDFKAGSMMEGRRVVSKKELAGMDIKEAIVYCYKGNIAQSFYQYFREMNIKILDIKAFRLGRAFGVFVGREHRLFGEYHKKENYSLDAFDSGEPCVQGLLDFELKNFYTKDEIIEQVITAFKNKQSKGN